MPACYFYEGRKETNVRPSSHHGSSYAPHQVCRSHTGAKERTAEVRSAHQECCIRKWHRGKRLSTPFLRSTHSFVEHLFAILVNSLASSSRFADLSKCGQERAMMLAPAHVMEMMDSAMIRCGSLLPTRRSTHQDAG